MDVLKGKVAVVTGAASGIGRAMAVAFAAEGMHVALADVEVGPLEDTATMVRDHGVSALAVPTDVSDPLQVEALAERTIGEFGDLHVACNNAGVSAGGLTWDIDLETWNWVLGVNFFGVIHGVRSFLPRIIDSGGGHIVNTASMAGLTSPAGMSPYNVSKHAVVTLSESLFQELAMTHPEVGVSVLCPGWVRTRIHESDRNRPSNPADAMELTADAPDALVALRDMVAGFIDGGLDPAAVAAHVVDAVKTNKTYILTHPHWQEMITERTQRIVSGQPPATAMFPTE